MYLCDECGQPFESPTEERDVDLEHFGHPCSETFLVSPCCHVGYFEAHQCDICGEWVADCDTQIVVCYDCGAKIFKKFNALRDEFTETERKYLNEKLECEVF